MNVDRTKILLRLVFLALFAYFVSRVVVSVIKLQVRMMSGCKIILWRIRPLHVQDGHVGTSITTASADTFTFPSVTICTDLGLTMESQVSL